jgi:hypothetical protein
MGCDEQDLPIIPHEVATGADCCGCLIVRVRGEQADITCNECGAVVRTVPVERVSAALLEISSIGGERAPSLGEIFSAAIPTVTL